jgi:deoxyadenosine/deoxycytidine kinase
MKIVFDGNIGCGKSRLINNICSNKSINMCIYNEPLHDWKEWLELFYSNMAQHAFGFQMRVLKSHLDKKVLTQGLFERSPLSCQNVFGKLLYEDNMMTELEWKLTNEFNDDYGWLPDIVVYLKCCPEICYERISKRNRDGENTISIDYLQKVHEKYEKLYCATNSEILKKIIIIRIDATQTPEQVYEEVINQLMNKISF